MSQRHVVGVDGSAPSRSALSWALGRAAGTDGLIVLAHVRSGGRGDLTDEDMAHLLDSARRAHPSVAVGSAVLCGEVVPALLAFLDEDDVLVIGTHKTGHLHGRAFGSTSVAIATCVTCSVVVVPELDLRFRRGIVAHVQGADDAVEELAADEAERRADELVLVQAAVSGEQDGSPVLSAAQRVQERHPLLSVSCRTTARAAAPALLDAALGNALLVIGMGRPPRADGRAFDPLLHDVLMNLTSPVLVARVHTHSAQPALDTKAAT